MHAVSFPTPPLSLHSHTGHFSLVNIPQRVKAALQMRPCQTVLAELQSVDDVPHVHLLWLHSRGVCGQVEVAWYLLNEELRFHPAPSFGVRKGREMTAMQCGSVHVHTVFIDWDLNNVTFKTNFVPAHLILDVQP